MDSTLIQQLSNPLRYTNKKLTAQLITITFNYFSLLKSDDTTIYNKHLKTTVCSIHLATVKRFLSDKNGPINCKLNGSCCDDNLIGTDIAGIPANKKVKI